jgi:hypothetical protein
MAKRLSIEVSDDVAALLSRVAEKQQTTMTDVVRRALAILKAAEKQKSLGREHFGFVKDPSKLDVELVGVMDWPPIMANGGSGGPLKGPKEVQRADDLFAPSAVKSVSEEPESVTLQRLKNERTAYILAVSLAAGIFAILVAFMAVVYLAEGTTEETRGRIAAGLIGAVSAALGVLAGKKL